MNIREALLEEHSKTQCLMIVAYVGYDKRKFAELMEIFLSNEYRVTQRAGWPLSCVAQGYPELINPYLGQLINMLKAPGSHPAVVRNITRIFSRISIPKKYHGKIMSACFEFITTPGEPAAVKAFSLATLEKFMEDYPEIGSELKLIIEEHWDHETPAFKSRAKRILKRLQT